MVGERSWLAKGARNEREPMVGKVQAHMQAEFIEIKGVGEGREEEEARTSLSLQKSWEEGEKSRNGRARLLKEPFALAYMHSDVAAVGLWAGQGTDCSSCQMTRAGLMPEF